MGGGEKKPKDRLNLSKQSMQPSGNHSDKPEGLQSLRVEVVRNSWGREADKGSTFAAGEKCLNNSIPGLTPLADSKRYKGILRPFMEQTLGGDKDLHSRRLKTIQKHVALQQVLQTWKPFTSA